MRTQSLITVLAIQAAILFPIKASADNKKNILRNAGFEKTKQVVMPEKEKRQMPDLAVYNEIPEFWSIDPVYKKDPASMNIIRDPEESHNGFKYIRLTGKIALMSNFVKSCKPEDKFIYTVWAKGEGLLEMWVYFYNYVAQNPNTPEFHKIIEISSQEWQKHTWEFSIPEAEDAKELREKNPYTARYRPALHVKGKIDLDDVCLIKSIEKETE